MAEIRSFIAVKVDRVIIERLAALQQEFKQSGADVSWTRPEGIHLTLKFLGNVDEERIPAIGTALEQVAGQYAPFSVTVAGTGSFPNARRPRVLWAGTTEGGDVLQQIAGMVEDAMAELDFPREDRPFGAHLTLGRVKSPANLQNLLPLVATHAEEFFGSMRVENLFLMRSDLSPHGARYTELWRAPLSANSV